MDLRHLEPGLANALETSAGAVTAFAKLSGAGPRAEERAAAVVERVSRETGITPKFNFRKLDGVLHVRAESAFIKALLQQPEVVAASSVPEGSSALIRPINVRPVDESAIDRPVDLSSPKK